MKHTPSEFVDLLSEKVIGQTEAKKTIAIALRNRWRRTKLAIEDTQGITPKNILMIGSTGVGKTAIIRAMADIIDAPMIKVEATRYTQIGYYGDNVNNMVSQLALEGYNKFNKLKRSEYSTSNDYKTHLTVKKANIVITEIDRIVRKELDDIYEKVCTSEIVDFELKRNENFYDQETIDEFKEDYHSGDYLLIDWLFDNKLVIEVLMASVGYVPSYFLSNIKSDAKKSRAKADIKETLKLYLNKNDFISQIVDIIVADPYRELGFNEDLLRGFIKSILDKIDKEKHVYVQAYIDYLYTFLKDDPITYEQLEIEENNRLEFKNHVDYIENMGIIFIDEIDKLADTSSSHDNVGKLGVQRDLLALLDGTRIDTDYGSINTDNILFIAAGAFHLNDVSDLMPELLGRLPVHVKLDDMNVEMMTNILENEKVSPLKQYVKLMKVDNINVEIEEGVIEAIAKLSNYINRNHKDMGARTLQAIIEKVFAKHSYTTSESTEVKNVNITLDDVKIVRKEMDSKISKEFFKQFLSTKFNT